MKRRIVAMMCVAAMGMSMVACGASKDATADFAAAESMAVRAEYYTETDYMEGAMEMPAPDVAKEEFNTEEESDLKYQADRELTDAAVNGEILTLSVCYKEPDGDTSVEENFVVMDEESELFCNQISADYALAAGVAELAMILNDSKYMGTADLDSAYDLVMQGSNDNKYREELAGMIKSLSY